MNVRREPTFEATAQVIDAPMGGGSSFQQAAADDNSKVLVWLALIIVGTAIGGLIAYFAARWYETRQVEVAFKQFAAAVGPIATKTQGEMAAINEQVRRAQALERERAARELAERQAAERRAREAEIARVAAVNAEVARREAAWKKFYVPSAACKNPDNRNTMECANEHLRAKKEFDKKWAASELR
jgi:hypothetical protein